MSRILMVASEAAPFVKTGGLGDVAGSLPGALARLGEDVAVVLPRYRSAVIDGAERIYDNMPLWCGPYQFYVSFDQVIRENVRFLFVDCPRLYDRPGVYNEGGHDYADNHIRFGLLNQAALGVARHIFRTDVFHAHDWQAGLLPYLLKVPLAGDPVFHGTKSVLTIHNLGYQGNFPASVLPDLGLDRGYYHPEGLEFFGRLSFLKAGIVWADAVTTVSPTYAQEIQTPEYGFSMDGLLRSRAAKLSGILNGVDYEIWNPETDFHLPAQYSAEDLAGKAICKRAVMEETGLDPVDGRPLAGIVSRMAHQKGFDLVAGIAAGLATSDVALVVLGSGEPQFEDMFRYFARIHPDRFAIRIGYDNGLAHRIEAGADMFLMPSRYEPCGLNQIYSLRYGTVPIVRATGGLEDTVDADTGFKFSEYSPRALAGAMVEALEAFEDRAGWTERMRRGMAKDFSWDASARRYQLLYKSL